MSYEIKNFQTDVVEKSRTIPVLVDFWADWCGPCRILGPVIERLAEEQKGRWVLAKLDTEAHPELAAQFGIRGIPNVKLFVDGEVKDEFMGALPENMIREWLNRALPGRFADSLKNAQKLLAEGQTSEAISLLEEIVREDGADPEARVMLAGLLTDDQPERVPGLLSGIEQDSAFFPAADALTTLLAFREKLTDKESLPKEPGRETYVAALEALGSRDYDRAVKLFIDTIRINRYYDDDASRKACVALFRFLGEDHEITRRYRREFAGALNV